ncbi:MAG: hypothetical protein ACKESB_03570, partial [Candidatus Hodgkinia cicadicola]
VITEIGEQTASIDLGWCRGELTLVNTAWYEALEFANSAAAGGVIVTRYGGMAEVSDDEGKGEVEGEGRSEESGGRGGEGGKREAEGGEENGKERGFAAAAAAELSVAEERDVRIAVAKEEVVKAGKREVEEETVKAGNLDEDGGKDEVVAVLFLGEPAVDAKEGILYGIVEEVTEQTVMVRMSPSLVQSVEAAVFKADVDETQAVRHTPELRRASVGDVVKVLPECLSLADKRVKLDVDVEGLRYLKFVEANIEFAIEGLISGIESSYAIVALSKGIFGKLEITDLREEDSGIVQIEDWGGLAVTVEICDFCPETNTIYLNVADDECARAALVEATACPS